MTMIQARTHKNKTGFYSSSSLIYEIIMPYERICLITKDITIRVLFFFFFDIWLTKDSMAYYMSMNMKILSATNSD